MDYLLKGLKMQENIISIVRIFPDFEEKIDLLFQSDENFRDLCSDHILCVATIKYMKNRPAEHVSEFEEYKDVQQKLEEDILKIIMKDTPHS